ncbi:hypothetical protein Ct61P_14513 [Colletotrichum tofieldiae]|nr:hypothetical protein Ct61P_14513 [Colletotrichum tofieldiae]
MYFSAGGVNAIHQNYLSYTLSTTLPPLHIHMCMSHKSTPRVGIQEEMATNDGWSNIVCGDGDAMFAA